MSELTTTKQKEYSIQDYLMSPTFHRQLALAAPRDVQAERMARAVLTLVRGDPKLASCTPKSLMSAAMCCAQTGLEPGALGHAAVVPYNGIAQWQAMYKGLLHLIYRSDKISAVQAGVVHELDEFDYDEGSSPFVHWKRGLRSEDERGDRIAVFAAIVPKEGPSIVRIEHISEIERIRKQYSKGKRDDRPWVTEYDEMARKTVVKRAAKLAPISVEMGFAIGYDDLAEVGKPQLAYTDEPKVEEYCNLTVGDTDIACSLAPGHEGECSPTPLSEE